MRLCVRETRIARVSRSRSRSLSLSLPRLPFPSFFAVFPSSSRPVSPVMLPPSRTAFIRSDFPCSYSPSFPFIYGSPFVSTSLLVFSMRDRPRYTLSLSSSVPSRTSPRSLSFSPVFRFARRVHSQFPSFPFVLDNLTSHLFLSPSPCIITPSSSFFFSIFVCILPHLSFSSTSLSARLFTLLLSLSPLVSLDSLTCALPRFSAAVSYRAWAPCRLVIVIVAAFDRPRPNSHTFPYTGKFVHGLASSQRFTPVPLYLFSVFVAISPLTSLQPSSFTYSFAC